MAYNFPDSPSNGDTVTINGIVYTYNSTKGAWKTTAASGGGGGGGASVTSSDTAPTNPSDGDLWWSSSEAVLYIYYADGDSSQWVQASTPGADGASGLNVTTSDTAPTSPSAGDFWWDSDANALFIYYTDADSSQWVQATTPGADGADGVDGTNGVDGADGSAAVYTNATDLPTSNNSTGDLAFVTSTNRLYIWNGSGWYNIALINTTPTISGVSSSYALAIDGTPTVVTITATDPEGLPITYDIVSDTSGSIATVTSNNNVFTITPSTNTADAGSFSLTFRASDGVNIASAISEFTLEFAVQNSNYTTALITSVGTNNQVNNSFVDSSTNSHTITAAGNVTQTTFSPYRHGGYSTYFDGSGDYLNCSYLVSNFGTNDFTIEAWVYNTSSGDYNNILDTRSGGTANALVFGINVSGYPYYYTGTEYASSTTLPLNTWVHLVLARSGSTIKIFQNGVETLSRTDSSNLTGTSTNLITIGRAVQGLGHFFGYLRDLRIVKGTAVYTSAFTPPTERLTAITNTSLLTCHLPYIADGSTNGHSITVNGNTKTESFSPYEYLTYSATDNGGSIYFDGSGDYLSSTITGPGTGDFTYEFWYYPTNSSFSGTAFNTRSSENSGADGFDLNLTSTSIQATYTNVIWLNASTSAIKAFSWNHIALVRNSGTVTIYVNGISVGTASQTSNFSSTSFNLFANVLNGTGLSGNVTDFRYATTAVYTSNFTPPTTPLTAITNTSLLLNGTNAGIIDKSQSVQTLTLSGDVKSSTTQTKYLSSSMYFDGSGDRISFPGNDMVNISSGDFTVEGWVHPTTSAFIKIFTMFTTTNANYAGLTFGISRTTSTTITVECASPSVGGGAAAVSITSSGTALNNAWSHIAFTREGNTFTLWVNGASEGTATFSGSLYWSPPNVYIGSGNDSAPSYFTGYLSDFRITKGLARYTANFTPPASELKG